MELLNQKKKKKKCFSREQMPWWGFANVQYDVNRHILWMLEGIFLLDVAHKS